MKLKIYLEKIKNFWKFDKQLHFAFSYLIALTAMLFLGYVGFVFGIIAGIAKETYDQITYGGWSWGDLLADSVGVILAVIVFIIKINL